MGRLQVRFPRLEPGYLVNVIGLRGRGYLEALVPATSQPAYRASEAPARAQAGGHAPARMSGIAICGLNPQVPRMRKASGYPALDFNARLPEQPLAGSGGPRLFRYLSVGSLLEGPRRMHGHGAVARVRLRGDGADLLRPMCHLRHLAAEGGITTCPCAASSPWVAIWSATLQRHGSSSGQSCPGVTGSGFPEASPVPPGTGLGQRLRQGADHQRRAWPARASPARAPPAQASAGQS